MVGPITYTLTKNILYRRAESLTETLSLNIDHILNKEMNQYISTIDTIIKDPSFDTLFNVSYQGDLASLYDSLYFLSSGYTIKPGIHIIDNNFNVIMNTITTPKEYYSEPFRSWGVLRKALVANGEPVLYYHQEKEDENRIMTIARVKIDENDEVLGMVLVDLYKEHISSFLPLEERFPQNSVLVLDEHNNRAFPIQGKIDDYALSAIMENLQSSKNIVRKGEHHPSFFYSLEYDEQFSFSVLTYYPLTQIDELLHLVAIIVISLAGLMTVMCIILALFVSRNAANPLQEVVDVLERVGKGDFTARTHIKRSDEFGKLGISVNEMVVKMKQLIDTNRQKEMSLRTSEIKSLMSQTKPHFIFNCLETIKWYILLGDTKKPLKLLSTLECYYEATSI